MGGDTEGVPYHPAEDIVLLDLIKENGTSWKLIVPQFNRTIPKELNYRKRTLSSLRNRFQRISKGTAQLANNKADAFGNKCKTCGLPKRGHICLAKLKGTRDEVLESPVESDIEDENCEEASQSGDETDDVCVSNDDECTALLLSARVAQCDGDDDIDDELEQLPLDEPFLLSEVMTGFERSIVKHEHHATVQCIADAFGFS